MLKKWLWGEKPDQETEVETEEEYYETVDPYPHTHPEIITHEHPSDTDVALAAKVKKLEEDIATSRRREQMLKDQAWAVDSALNDVWARMNWGKRENKE